MMQHTTIQDFMEKAVKQALEPHLPYIRVIQQQMALVPKN
jgi:hypothetical protein